MIKKIAGFALMLTLLTTTPALAATGAKNAAPAAPALAVEILLDHGVEPNGDILQLVAQEMGQKASFMGVEKNDPMYKHKVMHFLHCELGVISMEHGECMHHGMME